MLLWYGTLLQNGCQVGLRKNVGHSGKRLFRTPGKSGTFDSVSKSPASILQLKQSWHQHQQRKQIAFSSLYWTEVLFAPSTPPVQHCLQITIRPASGPQERLLDTTPLIISSIPSTLNRHKNSHSHRHNTRTLPLEIHSRLHCLRTPTNSGEACQRNRLSHNNLSPRPPCP